jgi:hypothetical protein
MTKGFALVQALTPEGIPGSQLTDPQKKLLMELLGEWIGNLNDDGAAPKLAAAKANLDKTYFAWGGPTTTGSAAYYAALTK